MKKYLIPILVLSILCLGVTSCRAFGYVEGTGPVVSQTYDFTDFKNVEISNAFGFDITRSENYSVTISAHQNLFNHMDIKKSGDTPDCEDEARKLYQFRNAGCHRYA